jgi:3-oxoacyl-[acyl-carrier protein] reductase
VKLQGKVALVTGSAANIGRATVLLFAAEGARVVVTTRSNVDGARAVVADIKAAGGEAVFVQADLANPAEADRLIAATIDNFGTLDLLVNNAGAADGKPFTATSREDWVSAFDDNLFSMVSVSQATAKVMLTQGSGTILNNASVRGIAHTGRPGIMAYSAAKAAVINFTKTLAKELAPRIRVNSVAPGFVITPNYDDMSEATKQDFIASTLIQRWILPTEIAEAFLYLATAEAVTGHNLVIDGGFTLK